jgi:hypothetical protein
MKETELLPTMTGREVFRDLVRRAGVPDRVLRALLDGATPGQGDWDDAYSPRRVIEKVIRALHGAGFTRFQSADILAASALAQQFEIETRFEVREWRKRDDAALGANFTITRVVRSGDHWYLTVQATDGTESVVKCALADLLSSETRYRKLLALALGYVPKLTGPKGAALVNRLMLIAEPAAPDVDDALIAAIADLVAETPGEALRMSATNLLAALSTRVGHIPGGVLPLGWPTEPQGLSLSLARLRPQLAARGIDFRLGRWSGGASQGQRSRFVELRRR